MSQKRKLTPKELILCSLFAALIAIGAWIQIPVPFMDYFTLQFLFVLLSGMILGPKLGLLSAAVYVAVGLIGFPVFAAGGGIGYVFRPSFGYLIGFIATAFTVGFLCDRSIHLTFCNTLFIAFSGMILTYAVGLSYKYILLNFYLNEPAPFFILLLSAFPLDIPGDSVLCIAAASLVPRLKKILERENLIENR